MNALLVQIALGNLLISGVLAGMAYIVHRGGRYPGLAHLLWVFVLIKLVTPPFLILPVAAVPGLADGVPSQNLAGSAGSAGALDPGAMVAAHGLTALLLIWGLGSLVVLAVSLTRIYRFDRLLRHTSREAPADIRHAADGMARHLGLRSTPAMLTSTARLSPMTWWTGGRVRIIIPETLPLEIGIQPLQWVLAHELAHVKRRDHLVRWLELLACVSFWWNPVAWWARQNLRFDEEASCDALVLERFRAEPRSYAGALLAVVEFLSRSTARPPVLATGIDTSGSLERRFAVILSRRRVRRAPRWIVAGVVAAALLVTPLGIGGAADTTDAGDGVPQALPRAAANEELVDVGSPAAPSIVVPDRTAAAPSDGYMMLSAELPDILTMDKTSSGEPRAKRVAEKTTRAARKAKRSVEEARRAAEQAQRPSLDPGQAIDYGPGLDAPMPFDTDSSAAAAALHGALIGMTVARVGP